MAHGETRVRTSSNQTRWGASLVLAIALGVSACEADTNPYGVPYRALYSIIGAYRPSELLTRTSPFRPGRWSTSEDGSDIRISVGSTRQISGRVFIPGRGAGGTDLNTHIHGTWTYDVPAQQLTAYVDPSMPIDPPRIVFQIEFLEDRIKLGASTIIDGISVDFDLAKPLPPEDAPATGGGNIPSFNQLPGGR